MLALKIRQNQLCRGIELPNGQNAKISQFADDTTLILEDTTSLRNAMNIVNSFGVLSGLQLNKKKTKALWIGVSRKNKTEPLKFQCPKDPIKFLGTYLSHDAAANNNNNFYIKIRKMETKLNIWRSRDLTLFGRTMLAKSLGLSQLIYTASMLSVPETVIQQTQSKLFAFLWKNKRDKIKRKVLFRPLSKGGLSFPCFRTAIKALRLSWISRLLNNTRDTWTAIPNYYFDKHGGLLFLLNCNYSVGKLDQKIPLFYRELLDYFQQLRTKIHWIANSSCGTTETLILKTNRSFGRPGGIKMFFLCKTCWTIKVIIFLHKNSGINIISKLTFYNTIKSPQLFPLISKVSLQPIWTLRIWTQFAKTSISNYQKISLSI